MKIYLAKSGASVIFEKTPHGIYRVVLRNEIGNLMDKIRCDTYRSAMDYFTAFKKVARAM